jgi:hypothetical protein
MFTLSGIAGYLFSSRNIPLTAVHDSLGILLGVNIARRNYRQRYYSEPLILLQGFKLIAFSYAKRDPSQC